MDLNVEIAKMIGDVDDSLKEKWLTYSPIPRINSPFQSMIIVNHFLRIQLGLLDMDTTKAREALTIEEDLDAWLLGFKEDILPIIITYGLPVWER